MWAPEKLTRCDGLWRHTECESKPLNFLWFLLVERYSSGHLHEHILYIWIAQLRFSSCHLYEHILYISKHTSYLVVRGVIRGIVGPRNCPQSQWRLNVCGDQYASILTCSVRGNYITCLDNYLPKLNKLYTCVSYLHTHTHAFTRICTIEFFKKKRIPHRSQRCYISFSHTLKRVPGNTFFVAL